MVKDWSMVCLSRDSVTLTTTPSGSIQQSFLQEQPTTASQATTESLKTLAKSSSSSFETTTFFFGLDRAGSIRRSMTSIWCSNKRKNCLWHTCLSLNTSGLTTRSTGHLKTRLMCKPWDATRSMLSSRYCLQSQDVALTPSLRTAQRMTLTCYRQSLV